MPILFVANFDHYLNLKACYYTNTKTIVKFIRITVNCQKLSKYKGKKK